MTVIEKARDLIKLEKRAKAAAAELQEISSILRNENHDLKLTGWSWERNEISVDILVQRRVEVEIIRLGDMT